MTTVINKALIIRRLMKRVPENAFGLPEGFYRSDLIPADLLLPQDGGLPQDQYPNGGTNSAGLLPLTPLPNGAQSPVLSEELPPALEVLEPTSGNGTLNPDIELDVGGPLPTVTSATAELDRILEVAYVPLSYDEGFPALPDGRPFWSQLEFESLAALTAFEAYLDQGRMGARQLFKLENIDSIAATMAELQEMFDVNYWKARARAFDLFEEAARRRARERAGIELEHQHGVIAESLLQKLVMYFEQEDEEGNNMFLELLTPKVAIDTLGKVVGIARMSHGLSATGGSVNKNGQPQAGGVTPVEVTIRQMAKADGLDPSKIGRENNAALEAVLRDPDATMMLQEIVIKANNPGTPPAGS